MNAVSEAGVYRLLFKSHKDYAATYQRWVTHDVLPALSREGHYEVNKTRIDKRLDDLEKMLRDSGIVRPFVNPRYSFDNLKTRFIAAVPGARARDFYEALGEWYGISVPYSKNLAITVKDWLLQRIPVDVMQEFVVGIETGTIVKSKAGYWVSLNGAFGNSVEWERIKHREFKDSCAYCGKKNVPLIPEHLISQSELSKTDPGRVDLVENIVPACADCNTAKGKRPLKEWYLASPVFSRARQKKLQEHYKKYHVVRSNKDG